MHIGILQQRAELKVRKKNKKILWFKVSDELSQNFILNFDIW